MFYFVKGNIKAGSSKILIGFKYFRFVTNQFARSWVGFLSCREWFFRALGAIYLASTLRRHLQRFKKNVIQNLLPPPIFGAMQEYRLYIIKVSIMQL